ncbi:hypothetical protein PMAYCL1PPCAC_03902, partial [Pristionchus mayeri]
VIKDQEETYFHFDFSPLSARELCEEALDEGVRLFTDLNLVSDARALHARGHVDGVAEEAVSGRRQSDNSRRDAAAVEADSQRK